MVKKKLKPATLGFTLIELLAVIVILSIIALIAVPIVINIINDSKKESQKRTIQNYLDTVEKTITSENLKVKYNPDECIIQENGNVVCYENGMILKTSNSGEELEINMNGTKPTEGTIYIENGKITKILELYIGEKYYIYNSSNNTIVEWMSLQPGLYDENYKLLATWDELVNKYNVIELQNYNNNYILSLYSDSSEDNLSNGTILVIANNITSIYFQAFSGCENLTSIMFEKNSQLLYIDDNAFSDCINLKSITIPKTVTSIGNFAFSSCESLKSITIPKSVTSIGENAFENCNSLESITFEKNSRLDEIGDYAFYGTKIPEFVIPASVTKIGDFSFTGDKLLSISFEKNSKLTSIGNYAFFLATNLKTITIPNRVQNIGQYAFTGCLGLETAVFENTGGWKIYNSLEDTEGTDVNVEDITEAAIYLKCSYNTKFWKKS